MRARGFDPLFALLVRRIKYKVRGYPRLGFVILVNRGGEWVSVREIVDWPELGELD